MLQVLFQSSADILSVVWHTGDNVFLEPSLFLEPGMFPQRLVAGVDDAGLQYFSLFGSTDIVTILYQLTC